MTHTPALEEEVQRGALLTDVRTSEPRARDGEIPGALPIGLNVREWRMDPDRAQRDAKVGGLDRRLLLIM